MRKLMKATCSIIIVCMLAVMAACTIEGFPRQTERVFVDRTEGWDNSFPYRISLFLNIDSKYKQYEEKILYNVQEDIFLGSITEENIVAKAEEAFHQIYGEESLTWKGDASWWQDGNNWHVWCGETLVIMDGDGKLLSCFNETHDPQFTISDKHDNGCFYPYFEYVIDFARMTEEELLEANDYVVNVWETGKKCLIWMA